MNTRKQQIARYAELVIGQGVNLQPGQCLTIKTEIGQRAFVQELTVAAYRAGARYVEVDWNDPLLLEAQLEFSNPDFLDYLPGALSSRAAERIHEGWAAVSVVGKEFPDLMDGADTDKTRRITTAYYEKMEAWRAAMMRNQLAWCVCAAPTPAWAQRVFPQMDAETAVDALWAAILAAAHVSPDGDGTQWPEHIRQLGQVAGFLNSNPIDSLHFADPTPGPDGKPSTDLTIGLTAAPHWISGASPTMDGLIFSPNIPTEEAFTTPDRAKAEGWTRSSKPFFPFDQEVTGAWFRFRNGRVTDYGAEKGKSVLDQFFGVEGTRSLGEVALVDAGSPIFQSGLLFHNTLFDENAAIHLAFGRGYAIGIQNGGTMDAEALDKLGLNLSSLHVDTMIGTETMNVTAHHTDGSQTPIMRDGRYTKAVLGA
ncbi:MAG: aminopeptidase [Caldilineaceae bacterium]|nr:aminopeptidase [Caldilineaceae bacterium]